MPQYGDYGGFGSVNKLYRACKLFFYRDRVAPKAGRPDAHVVLAMANDPILQSTPQENTSASVELGALNNSALPGKYRRDAIHCRCNPL